MWCLTFHGIDAKIPASESGSYDEKLVGANRELSS